MVHQGLQVGGKKVEQGGHYGVVKKTPEDLNDHVKRRPANNHWHCVFQNCTPQFKSVYNYSLKKHVQNKQYKEYIL